MNFDYTPPSRAAICVQYLHVVPDMHAWSEMCLAATAEEGAGPMAVAARLPLPLGHHPDVRKIMRLAAKSHLIYFQLVGRL